MRRFILEPGVILSDTMQLDGALFHHIVNVLRMQEGDRLELTDANGDSRYAGIISVSDKSLTLNLDSETRKAPCRISITLYQSLPKGEKTEFIIQKAVELGVSRIILFPSIRSVVKIHDSKLHSRLERYRKISAEAARQSLSIPSEICYYPSLNKALESSDESVRIAAFEEESLITLHDVLSVETPLSAAVLIGPEGGFTKEEIESASAFGFQSVSLGRRILRTETAGLAVLSILQYVWGDV